MDNIQEVLERSIYKALREKAVSLGYAVSEDTLTPDATGKAAYQLAINNIVVAKGFAIEVYGVGSSLSKGEKQVPRIVIQPGKFIEGDIGGLITPQIIPSPDSLFTNIEVTGPGISSNFTLDIHLISSSATQNRILHNIFNSTIGLRKFLKTYNTQENFFVKQVGNFDVYDNQEGLIEKVYTISAPDIFIETDGIPTTFVPINEITFTTTIEGTFGNNQISTGTSETNQISQ